MQTPVLSSLKPPTAVKEALSGNVRVFCRFRPLNSREMSTTEDQLCVTFKNAETCSVMGINKNTGNSEPIDYNFDAVYDPNSQ